MIIIKLKGGLGNQMFQYAFGRKLSLKLPTELALDINEDTEIKGLRGDLVRPFLLNRFDIKAHVATLEEVAKLRKPFSLYLAKIFRKLGKYNHYKFDPKAFEIKDNTYLEGFWWQSEQYFKDIRPQLLEDFTLVKDLGTDAEKIAESIRQAQSSVSVHIRRGDYANNPVTLAYHGLAPMEYYEQAIKIIQEKRPHSIFYIFSDDIEWLKANFPLPPLSQIVSDKNIPEYEELALMSLCKDHIIANSSFSWWGAWLSKNDEKIVIAPQQWIADKTVDTDDVCPKEWIRV